MKKEFVCFIYHQDEYYIVYICKKCYKLISLIINLMIN